jgi:hypothetical protein
VTPARHAEVRAVLAAALRWVPSERAAVIAALAGDDRALADEVLDLLAHVDEEPQPAARGVRAIAIDGQPLAALVATIAGPRAMAQVLSMLAPLAAVEIAHDDDEDDGPWTREAAALCAPEELEPSLGPRGPWTEVYVVAVLVVTLLRGGSPPVDVAGVLARARDDDAQPTPRALGLALPPAVDDVLTRALVRSPRERIQNLQRLFAQLDAAAKVEPTSVAGASSSASAAPSPPRGRSLALMVVGVALVVAAILALR